MRTKLALATVGLALLMVIGVYSPPDSKRVPQRLAPKTKVVTCPPNCIAGNEHKEVRPMPLPCPPACYAVTHAKKEM